MEEAVRIATEVADALDYAHRHDVIHRDIKPENILLHDGRPVVAGFGIALAVSAAAGGRMTETGLSLGTPRYMSPEQATADKDITGRSDLYSLASVLYEMLTGNPPHTGASAQQIIMKIIVEPVEVVTKHRKSVPPNVVATVSRALEKLPADRFATAQEFAVALRNPAFAFAVSWPSRGPQFLPGDRAAVATARKKDEENWIVVVDMSTGEVRELGIRGTYPHYSSGQLFFATFGGELFSVPFDARTHEVTGQPELVAEELRVGSGGAATFTASHNGTLAMLTSSSSLSRRELVAVNRTGVERSLSATSALYSLPSISPDARRIAVTIDADTVGNRPVPRYPDVWTIDLTTSARVRITTDSASSWPVWVADGQLIAYSVRRDTVVYAVPVFGAGPARPYLRGRGEIGQIALGRTGGLSAFVPNVQDGGPRDIWVTPTDASGDPRPFLNAPYNEINPAISPDGRWIAYMTDRTGRTEVYVRALEGEGVEIPVSISGGIEPVWSSDGTELFYRTGAGRTFMVARLAFAPRLDVVRRDSLFSGVYRTGYAVFPSGKELLLVKDPRLYNAQGAVTLLVNWRPGRSGVASEP